MHVQTMHQSTCICVHACVCVCSQILPANTGMPSFHITRSTHVYAEDVDKKSVSLGEVAQLALTQLPLVCTLLKNHPMEAPSAYPSLPTFPRAETTSFPHPPDLNLPGTSVRHRGPGFVPPSLLGRFTPTPVHSRLLHPHGT